MIIPITCMTRFNKTFLKMLKSDARPLQMQLQEYDEIVFAVEECSTCSFIEEVKGSVFHWVIGDVDIFPQYNKLIITLKRGGHAACYDFL